MSNANRMVIGARVRCKLTGKDGTVVAPPTFTNMRRIKWDGYDHPVLQQVGTLAFLPAPKAKPKPARGRGAIK
jgi:hypothetical protein